MWRNLWVGRYRKKKEVEYWVVRELKFILAGRMINIGLDEKTQR